MVRLKIDRVAATQVNHGPAPSLNGDAEVPGWQLGERTSCAYVSQTMLEDLSRDWTELFHRNGLILTNGAKQWRVEGNFHEHKSGAATQSSPYNTSPSARMSTRIDVEARSIAANLEISALQPLNSLASRMPREYEARRKDLEAPSGKQAIDLAKPIDISAGRSLNGKV